MITKCLDLIKKNYGEDFEMNPVAGMYKAERKI